MDRFLTRAAQATRSSKRVALRDRFDSVELVRDIAAMANSGGGVVVLDGVAGVDVELIHELWLDAYKTIGPQVHHRDIVSTALRELAAGLSTDRRDAVLARLKQQTGP